MVEILILSLVQGITEFLPVSSSSHLLIFSKFGNFENQNLMSDISLHIGSFIAVICFFYKDLINFIKNKELFFRILISSIPIIVIGGILVQTNLIEKIRNIETVAWTTLIFGILLFISDKYKLKKNIKYNFNYKSALIIGLFQVLSLIPGVSRSGITITAARLLNFKRFDSAKISFFLSIPTLGAVTIFGLGSLLSSHNLHFSEINVLSIFFSFIISFLTIKYFLIYIKKFSLKIFVIYRVILGLILLIIVYL